MTDKLTRTQRRIIAADPDPTYAGKLATAKAAFRDLQDAHGRAMDRAARARDRAIAKANADFDAAVRLHAETYGQEIGQAAVDAVMAEPER